MKTDALPGKSRIRSGAVRSITVMLIIVMLFSSLSLTACHGRRSLPEFEVPASFDLSRDYEITFWAKNDTNKAQTDIYSKAIKDFESFYPNIHVNTRFYTDYGRIYNDVITNISTNTTPNVCITYPDHIATYMTGVNTVVPLDGLASDPSFGFGGNDIRFDAPGEDAVIGKFLDECRIGGVLYALPYMRSTEACYINKTFVEALGFTVPDILTWDYVWEVSEAATAKNADGTFAVNGQNVMIPFIYKSTDNMMIQYLAQKNADYTSADGRIGLFNDTAFGLLRDVRDHVATGAFSTFKISSYPANFLNAGQCIFAVDSTAGSTWMGSDAPLSDISEDMLVDFETVVRMIPQCDPSSPKMISQGPSLCIFNKEDPQEVLASWIFAQFMLTNGVQTAYARTEGYVPVTKNAHESAEYLDYLAHEGTSVPGEKPAADMENGATGEEKEAAAEYKKEYYDIKLKATKLLLENIDNTFVTPVFNGSASVRDAAGQMIENVAKSVRRKENVDGAYMEKLEKDIVSLYRLDRLTLSGQNTEPGEASSASEDRQTDATLPAASVVLICLLCVSWVLLAGYAVLKLVRKRSSSRARSGT